MAIEPREIVVGPLKVYVAVTGTAFPLVDAAPAVAWKLLGKSGEGNYSEDGITLTHEQTFQQFRTLGSTGPLKASRTEENLMLAFQLQDLSLEQYARALNDVTVTLTAGPPSRRSIPLRQGFDVAVFALLARGAGLSPYGNFPVQLEVPRVYQSANPAPVFSKGGVAALELTFTALEDTTAATPGERFGRWVMQDA